MKATFFQETSFTPRFSAVTRNTIGFQKPFSTVAGVTSLKRGENERVHSIATTTDG